MVIDQQLDTPANYSQTRSWNEIIIFIYSAKQLSQWNDLLAQAMKSTCPSVRPIVNPCAFRVALSLSGGQPQLPQQMTAPNRKCPWTICQRVKSTEKYYVAELKSEVEEAEDEMGTEWNTATREQRRTGRRDTTAAAAAAAASDKTSQFR